MSMQECPHGPASQWSTGEACPKCIMASLREQVKKLKALRNAWVRAHDEWAERAERAESRVKELEDLIAALPKGYKDFFAKHRDEEIDREIDRVESDEAVVGSGFAHTFIVCDGRLHAAGRDENPGKIPCPDCGARPHVSCTGETAR